MLIGFAIFLIASFSSLEGAYIFHDRTGAFLGDYLSKLRTIFSYSTPKPVDEFSCVLLCYTLCIGAWSAHHTLLSPALLLQYAVGMAGVVRAKITSILP